MGGSFARTLLPDAVPTATYSPGNRQVEFGDHTLTFDANGNTTTITRAGGTTTLTWDARNRLTALAAPGTRATFTYGSGRREAKTVNGAPTGYLYDGADVIQQLNDAANTIYIRSLAVDELLALSGPQGTLAPLADALASTMVITDNTGAPSGDYRYAPFGATESTIAPPINPFQFTGRENDQLGLYHYRARYYDPVLHRFISEDPIGFSGGNANLYAYVHSSPVNWTDPFGLDAVITRWRCCGGFDHIGIGVNTGDTKGFYPMRSGRPFDGGIVLSDLQRYEGPDQLVEFFVIKTTPQQDERISAYIARRTLAPGRYNILSGRHCGGFVQDALRAGEIDPLPTVLSPAGFFEALRALRDAGMDFTVPNH